MRLFPHLELGWLNGWVFLVLLVLVFVGACVAVGSWAALLTMVVTVLFGHFRILAEERACLAQYGDPYRDLLSRVPRYLLLF
jgi:protein-S-isoprenylcysteine O-methyltransferase Ste14